MKKLIIATAIASVLSTSAFAEGNFYGKFEAGVVKPLNFKDGADKLKGKSNADIGLGFGYKLNENVRIELGLSFYKINYKNTANNEILKFRAIEVMPKIYYDIMHFDQGNLFVGAGVGLVNVKEKSLTSCASTGKLLLTAGTSFKASESVNFDLAYNFKYSPSGNKGSTLKTHGLTAGVRVSF